MVLDRDFWAGKRVFVTGHTGFKGSWLCLWLRQLGADVTGFALPPPTDPSLFATARIDELVETHTGDVRDLAPLEAALASSRPEIVLHLAAQPIVRYSYEHPVETFATNVLGTVNLLDGVRRTSSVRAVVVVTSDKCYFNEEWVWGYREDSRLGGHDPYSASKSCAELVVASYQHSFFSPERNPDGTLIASGRAGNVIGGGDWALDRLVPDIIRSLLEGKPTIVRNPHATRPWQHVLEPLHGYLMLAERLVTDGPPFASAWNFGPAEENARSVGSVINDLYELWGVDFDWERDRRDAPPESTFLKLDSSKARAQLGWQPKLDLLTTLRWIVDWTRGYAAGADVRELTLADIDRYMAVEPRP